MLGQDVSSDVCGRPEHAVGFALNHAQSAMVHQGRIHKGLVLGVGGEDGGLGSSSGVVRARYFGGSFGHVIWTTARIFVTPITVWLIPLKLHTLLFVRLPRLLFIHSVAVKKIAVNIR